MNAALPFLNLPDHGLNDADAKRARASVNDKHRLLVHAELERLVAPHPRLSLHPEHWKFMGVEVLYVDGQKHWNYYAYSAWGQRDNRPVTEWAGHVVVSAVTERDSRDIIDLRELPIDLFYDGATQASIIVNTVLAHVHAGLPGIDIAPLLDEDAPE